MKPSVFNTMVRLGCCLMTVVWLQACNNAPGGKEFLQDIDWDQCMDGRETPQCPQNSPREASGVSWDDAFSIIGILG
jgi:hypothetical protein